MQVEVFPSRRESTKFGFTPDKSGGNLPADLAPWSHYKTVYVNEDDAPRTAIASQDVLNGIRKDGYYVSSVELRFDDGKSQ